MLCFIFVLAGFKFAFHHLDGRVLHIHSHRGDVISPDGLKAVEHEGMPLSRNAFLKGHLVFKFKVVFPSMFSDIFVSWYVILVYVWATIFSADKLSEPQISTLEQLFHLPKEEKKVSSASGKLHGVAGAPVSSATLVVEEDDFVLGDFHGSLDGKSKHQGKQIVAIVALVAIEVLAEGVYSGSGYMRPRFN